MQEDKITLTKVIRKEKKVTNFVKQLEEELNDYNKLHRTQYEMYEVQVRFDIHPLSEVLVAYVTFDGVLLFVF